MNSPKSDSYGIRRDDLEPVDPLLEKVKRDGFAVIPEVIPQDDLAEARERLDEVYRLQTEAFGEENLAKISELKLARSPFLYDSYFRQFYLNQAIRDLVGKLLGDYYILHLQNGILNPPRETHHQAKWHRDLPYQQWTSSKPLAVNAMVCIDDFTSRSGGTSVLPHSHRFDDFPSDQYVDDCQVTLEAPAGSVAVFDSMLYHRAGENLSDGMRRGLNHVFTTPILKQQIDYPKALGSDFKGSNEEKKLLGFDCSVPASVTEWRERRLQRSGS